MGKKIYVIGIIILGIIGIVMILNAVKTKNVDEPSGKVTQINTLEDLFAEKIGEKYTYSQGNQKYKVKVTNIEEKEGDRIVTTQREEETGGEKYIVEMEYRIEDEKVLESGRHLKDGEEVSTIYPVEILADGMPYEGKTWTSVDGNTTNVITSMRENKVVVESSRKDDTVGTIIETRVLEVGKGLISYNVTAK